MKRSRIISNYAIKPAIKPPDLTAKRAIRRNFPEILKNPQISRLLTLSQTTPYSVDLSGRVALQQLANK